MPIKVKKMQPVLFEIFRLSLVWLQWGWGEGEGRLFPAKFIFKLMIIMYVENKFVHAYVHNINNV